MTESEKKQLNNAEHELFVNFINGLLEDTENGECDMTVTEVYQKFYEMRISQIIENTSMENAKSIYSFALAFKN